MWLGTSRDVWLTDPSTLTDGKTWIFFEWPVGMGFAGMTSPLEHRQILAFPDLLDKMRWNSENVNVRLLARFSQQLLSARHKVKNEWISRILQSTVFIQNFYFKVERRCASYAS